MAPTNPPSGATAPSIDQSPAKGSRVVWLSASITYANLAIFHLVVVQFAGYLEDHYDIEGLVPQYVWPPLDLAVILQIAATGLLLMSSKPGRAVGLGLVLAAVAALASLAALAFLLAVTIGS